MLISVERTSVSPATSMASSPKRRGGYCRGSRVFNLNSSILSDGRLSSVRHRTERMPQPPGSPEQSGDRETVTHQKIPDDCALSKHREKVLPAAVAPGNTRQRAQSLQAHRPPRRRIPLVCQMSADLHRLRNPRSPIPRHSSGTLCR